MLKINKEEKIEENLKRKHSKNKMSKIKSKIAKVQNRREDTDEVDTSDDDFIDPSMEKYFNNKNKPAAKKNGVLKPEASKVAESNGVGNQDEDDEDDEDKELESESNGDDNEDISEEDEEEEEDEMEFDQMNLNADEDGGKLNDVDSNDGRTRLTLKMIKIWSNKLSGDKPFSTIVEVCKAFKSALLSVIPNKKVADAKYRVEGPESTAFCCYKVLNELVRLCMRDLVPCWLKLLDLKAKTETENKSGARIKLASSGKHWKKLKVAVKSYLDDLLSLINAMNEPNVLNSLLRHVRILVNFYLCFPKILKSLIKVLVTIWSQSDEKSRVLAFLCLHKIVLNTHESNQELIFKSMYLAFARNSKFTSINTLPMINFMQRSLVEIFACNLRLTYEHVFVYIRQLAIHLRNAMNTKKKETFQAVYNWQFVHSLELWSKLLASLVPSTGNESLKQLVYPLTQVIIGTIKLIPTPRYYPLRFHCVNALIILSNATGIFIPILPFILEIFDITDFNKKHATVSVKPVNFSLLLKLNKQQLQDKSFKDVLIDTIYDNLILLFQGQSHDIAFPELSLPFILRIKEFLNKSKVQNYSKVMKGLLDKVNENYKFIEERRSKATLSLRDNKAVDSWMEQTKSVGTPMSQWYSRYKTLRERELLMEASNKEQISKNQIPLIERPSAEQKEAEKREFSELFVDGHSDESDSELLDFVPKKKLKKSSNKDEEVEESEDDFEEALNGKNQEDNQEENQEAE